MNATVLVKFYIGTVYHNGFFILILCDIIEKISPCGQGAPVFKIHKILLNISRLSLAFRPRVSFLGGASICSICFHFSSGIECLFINRTKSCPISNVYIFLNFFRNSPRPGGEFTPTIQLNRYSWETLSKSFIRSHNH